MREGTLQSIVDDCYDTVVAIAASRYCVEFIVGYTHRPLRRRKYDYFNSIEVGYEHLVVLIDRLNQRDAHWIEERLQVALKTSSDNLAEVGKYSEKRRKLAFFASAGGHKLPEDAEQCSIYMSWKE